MADYDVKAYEQMTAVQKRTFTRWMNHFLSERLLKVEDLFTDLKDGKVLINLLELISSKTLRGWNKAPKLALHEMQNLNIALDFIKEEGLKLVNIDATDIHTGKPKLILGLIWTLILRYQIQMGGEGASPKQELLDWVNRQIAPYEHIPQARNFTDSWQDGKILSALTDSLHPGVVETKGLHEPLRDTAHAMAVSEREYQIPQLVDAADMVHHPDEHSNMTYIALFRDYLENKAKHKEQYKLKGPHPDSCFAKGKGVEGGFARRPLPFTIHSRNVGNSPVVGKWARPMDVKVTGPSGVIPCEVRDNGDGTFFGKYIAPTPGDYKVSIEVVPEPIDGAPRAHIKGSVYDLKVREASDPKSSYAEGPGLQRAWDNQPNKFKVFVRDEDGKPVAGEPVAVTVTPKDGGPSAPVDIKDNGDGTYDVAYNTNKPGDYVINATLNGEPIRDMPKHVKCFKGIDPSKSVVEGPGVEKGFAGRRLPFTVKTLDKDGKLVPIGGQDVVARVLGPKGAVPCELKDNGDGTYSGAYTPEVPGDYKVTVLLDQEKPIGKSPYTCKVKPGASPAQSFAVGRGWKEAYDALPTMFTIYVKDSEGQPVIGDKLRVVMRRVTPAAEQKALDEELAKMDDFLKQKKAGKVAKLEAERKAKQKESDAKGAPGAVWTDPEGDVAVEIRDNGDGSYLAQYTAPHPGKYEISVTVTEDKLQIKESPKVVPVHLSRPKIVYWKHTHAAEKQEMERLKKTLQDYEKILKANGLLPQ
jgi:filamin